MEVVMVDGMEKSSVGTKGYVKVNIISISVFKIPLC